MDKYKIAETEQFQKKITDYIYPLLRKNTCFVLNIKKLKGEFSGLYRYRLGKLKLFYEIDNDKIIVFIIDIEDRKDAYNSG